MQFRHYILVFEVTTSSVFAVYIVCLNKIQYFLTPTSGDDILMSLN